MFDDHDEPKAELPRDPLQRAKEKAEEFCLHAEIAAVFEGTRKMDAELRGLGQELAREVQQTMGRLAKSKAADHPVLPEPSAADAAAMLRLPDTRDLATNDYYVYRRPGEVMVVRWLAGDQVEAFYERMQAHFEAGVEGCREDERNSHGWKQDADTLAYLKALDAVELKMADRYLRDVVRTHKAFVLSTLTADELNIAFLAEDVMGLPTAELVGAPSAPPTEGDATDRDRAWFFKLFSLRGMIDDAERSCFFAYLQKTEDTFGGDW